MLSPHFERFCDDWLAKAVHCDDHEIDGCYDKFFTLFVVFNRLYAEATFELARRGEITLQPDRAPPDRKGATEYTLQFIGQAAFNQLFDNGLSATAATLAQLIDDEVFHIKLRGPNGEAQRQKDLALAHGLRSTGKTRALAMLDLVYSVRCNLFHGHKAFEAIQTDLLRPANEVVLKVIQALKVAHGMNGG